MGRFRWFSCQLDLLLRLRTLGVVKKALASLPPTLDQTYESLLLRIDECEDWALTREILEIFSFASELLSLEEVCEILQIAPKSYMLDKSKRLTNLKDVLSICGSLLNYREELDLVKLAHHSVKIYLVSDLVGPVSYFKLSDPEAQRFLSVKCLTYFIAWCLSWRPSSVHLWNSQPLQAIPFFGLRCNMLDSSCQGVGSAGKFCRRLLEGAERFSFKCRQRTR